MYGQIGSLIYTLGICLSALGSLNANVFAIGRLAAAASKRNYIPELFSGDNGNDMSVSEERRSLHNRLQNYRPKWLVSSFIQFAGATARLRLEEGIPVLVSISVHVTFWC
jgi:amino acid transporter